MRRSFLQFEALRFAACRLPGGGRLGRTAKPRERAGDLRRPSPLLRHVEGLFDQLVRDPQPRLAHRGHNGPHGFDEAILLGLDQEADGPGDPEPLRMGGLATEPVVHHHQVGPELRGQGDGCGLSRTDTTDQLVVLDEPEGGEFDDVDPGGECLAQGLYSRSRRLCHHELVVNLDRNAGSAEEVGKHREMASDGEVKQGRAVGDDVYGALEGGVLQGATGHPRQGWMAPRVAGAMLSSWRPGCRLSA